MTSSLLLVGCVYQFWYQPLKRRKQQLPFPQIPHHVPDAHWFLGHLPLLANIVQGQEVLCRKYAGAGDQQISSFFVMHTPTFSTLNAGLVRRLLQATSERKAPPLQLRHFGKLFGKHSILFQNGSQWKNSRSLAHRVFKATNLQSSALSRALWEATDDVERSLQNTILELGQEHPQQRTILNMDGVDLARIASLQVFGIAGLGHDFGCTTGKRLAKSPIFECTTFLQADCTRRCFQERFNLAAQMYNWPGSDTNRRHRQAMTELRGTLQHILQKRREEMEANRTQQQTEQEEMNLIDSLLHGSHVTHDMDDEVLSDWMVTILFGGYDTTALALSYVFYLLARHDNVQRNCAREAVAVLGERRTTDVDVDDHSKMDLDITRACPYIWACIWEALRLYPPATVATRNLLRPFTFDMNTDSNSEVGSVSETKSVTLETGTRIICSFYWIHRSERNFPRPHEFLPERWAQRKVQQKGESPPGVSEWEERTPDNDRFKNDANYIQVGDPSNHLSFSTGARNCVGQAFASKMLPTIVAMIIKSTQIELQDQQYQLELMRYGGNAAPKGGIPMKFSKRDPLLLQ